ncbi:hypothetical protein T492DRAFT_833867 [Pavlovales sp. CCMP2436]|nr:hypothetical protein T492DRAFT_833867 [Pavlovales sp. CCMP2436]
MPVAGSELRQRMEALVAKLKTAELVPAERRSVRKRAKNKRFDDAEYELEAAAPGAKAKRPSIIDSEDEGGSSDGGAAAEGSGPEPMELDGASTPADGAGAPSGCEPGAGCEPGDADEFGAPAWIVGFRTSLEVRATLLAVAGGGVRLRLRVVPCLDASAIADVAPLVEDELQRIKDETSTVVRAAAALARKAAKWHAAEILVADARAGARGGTAAGQPTAAEAAEAKRKRDKKGKTKIKTVVTPGANGAELEV